MTGDADLSRSLVLVSSRVRRRFSQRMAEEPWAREKGLRSGCYAVLRTIHEAGAVLSQREVSEVTGVDPSDVVALIDLLESAGFVERRRDLRDRRRYALTITSAGRDAVARYTTVARAVEDEVFAGLSTKDRRLLGGLLERALSAEGTDLTEAVGA